MGNGRNPEYQRVTNIQKNFDVSGTKLLQLSKEGKVRILQCGENGNRLYNISDLKKLYGFQDPLQEKTDYIYCRVSSEKQQEDLQRQIHGLQNVFPNVKVVKDIGSGINFKKKGINFLLKEVLQGKDQRIIVTDKDRLCRFGYELFESVCKHFGTEILVQYSKDQDSDTELGDDLLTICNVFVAKKNGKRAQRNKRIQELQD